MANIYDQFDDVKQSANIYDQFDTPSRPKSRTWGDVAGDIGVTALKGAIGLPQALVGLADIPTGGIVGKTLEGVGYRPNEASKQLDDLYSDPQKAANRKVAEAEGFTGTLAAHLQNPSTIATTVGESVPQMLGGAGVARGLMKAFPKVAAWAAGALGEGIMGAGSAEEQTRAESADGLTTAKQGMAALASGAGTAVFGMAGGRLAGSKLGQKLGLADVDTMLASGKFTPSTAGFFKAVAGSGISEGVLEEMPQSAWEQMLQNYAQEKPLTEGIGKSMASGLVAGAAMGGAGGGFNAAMAPKPANPAVPPVAPPADPLQLGNTPDPMISFPDGTVARRSEVDQYIANLPEDQQVAARAKLSGFAPQKATIADIGAAPNMDDAIAAFTQVVSAPVDLAPDISDAQEFADLVQSEARNQQVMLAQMDQDRIKQAQLDQIPAIAAEQNVTQEALQRAAALDAPTAMGSAFSKLFDKTIGAEPEARETAPAPVPAPKPVPEPRIVARDPGMLAMPRELAELRATMNGGELVRVQNQNGKFAYTVLEDGSKPSLARVANAAPPASVVDQRLTPVSKRTESTNEKAPEAIQSSAQRPQAPAATGPSKSAASAGVAATDETGGAPSPVEVSRYTGKFGKGMGKDAARLEAQRLNRAADGITYAAEEHNDPKLENPYAVVGRKDFAQPENKPKQAGSPAERAQAVTETVAPKKAKKPKGGQTLRAAAYDKNPLMTFLATHGLFHDKAQPNSHKSEFSPDKGIMVMGYGPVFKKTGKRLDVLTQNAIEEGYLPKDGTEAQLRELVRRAVAGEKISPMYAQGVAEQLAEQSFAEHLAQQQEAAQDDDYDPFQPLDELGYEIEDALSAGRSDLTPALQNEVDALLLQAEDVGIDIDQIKSDAATETEKGSQDDYLSATKQRLEAAITGRAANSNGGSTEQDGGQGRGQATVTGSAESRGENDDRQEQSGSQEGLTSPTREDVLAQQDRADAAKKAEEKAAADAANRAKADAERGEFTLTGSDRAADVGAAGGQQDIFSSPAAEATAILDAADVTGKERIDVLKDVKKGDITPDELKAAYPAKIDDVGEKIGGARKDTATSTGPKRKTASEEDDRPTWAKRFQIAQVAGGFDASVNGRDITGKWTITDTRTKDRYDQPKRLGEYFASKEAAEAALPLIAVAQKHRVAPTGQKNAEGGYTYEIWRDVNDRKRVKVVDQVFDSREEAMKYMAQHATEILETNTTFGEADLPKPENTGRVGVERRTGDVKGEDFRDAFGFRGVEFGLWNNQEERQEVMNAAYDGLMDLAEVLKVPPKAIGLNGDLALAFGARGKGLSGARAHYETDRVVMNLTKMNGAGALAHEWFHALDHYLARQDGKTTAEWKVNKDGTRSLDVRGGDADMASSGFLRNNSGVREELRTAYTSLVQSLFTKAEQYVEDTARADKFVAVARGELEKDLADLRKDLSEQKDVRYYKRNNKPASAEQLAEFDAMAAELVEGRGLATEWKAMPGKARMAIQTRHTNETLEKLNELYKAVRGRSGFNAEHRGVLDALSGYMKRYDQRLQMLREATALTSKTKRVPTSFAMDAKSLDQGRGGDYWTTPHEMVARAFQGYVEDAIAAKEGRSPFLNYGPENAGILTPWGAKRPFPAGAERKAMNAEFEKFIDVLETKETDKGVAMFSRAQSETEALQSISENDDLFQYEKSDKNTVEGVAKDINPAITVRKLSNIPGETRYILTTPDGNTHRMMVRPFNPYADKETGTLYGYNLDKNNEMTDVVMERPGKNSEAVEGKDDVYIDVSLMQPGQYGAQIYSIAQNYAHNAGKIFIGDPAGLSDKAMKRRVENMLSSALKFGTTEHLAPHPRQVKGDSSIGVPALDWTYGDDLANIKSLVNVSNAIYGPSNPVTFEPRTGQFLDSEGGVLDDDAISLIDGIRRTGKDGVGLSTAKRNAVLSAILREESQANGGNGSTGRGLLDRLMEVGVQYPVSTRGIFYSRGERSNTGLTPTQFTAELSKAFGSKVAEKLQAKGVVVPLADQSKLPAHVVPFLRDGDIIYGFYDPKTDRTYAVLENLTSEMVKGLTLHEVGVHYGFKSMLGDAKYANVMQRLDVMRRAGSKTVKEAYAQAKANAVRDSQVAEETLAYLVQTAPEMSLVKEIIARIKAFLYTEFGIGGKYLNEADLTMLARAAVDHASRLEDGGSAVPAFMRDIKEPVTNPNDVVGNQGGRSADDTTPGGQTELVRNTDEFVSPIFSPEQVAKALDENRWLDRGLKLGRGQKIYRGVSEKTGRNTANFGRGLYTTTDMSEARQYGRVTEMVATDLPQNPLRFSDEGKFREWESYVGRELLGFRRIADFDAKHGTPDRWIPALDTSIDGIQIGTGPGAFFVKFPNESTAPDSGGAMFSRAGIVGQTNRQHTPEQLRAMKNVGFDVEAPTLKERAQALYKDAGKKLAQGIVDQFAPVKDLDKNAYGLLRLAKGASGAFEAFLQGGKLKLTDGVYDFDDANKGGVIDKLLIPLQGEHHDFMRWVAANRAERLQGEGKENLFSAQDIADLKTLASGTADFDYTVQTGPAKGRVTRDRTLIYADANRVFNEFNKNVLDMAEQSGLIDGASRKVWEHEFYVPFYRVADEDGGGVRGMSVKGSVLRQQAFKELKGGKNALNADLLDNTLMNWAHLLDASAKNRAAKATIEAAERMGVATGGDQATLAQMGASIHNKHGVVWFMDGGQKRYSLIDKEGDGPYLMTAINALEYAGMRNPVMNAMGAMKHALTVGVTASPFFKIRNLIRDSVQAIGTGNLSYNPAKNITEGWKLTDPKSDAYFRLLAGGGTIHFGTMLEGSEAKRVQALVESGVDDATILGDDRKVKAFYRKYIEPGITAYSELGNRGEAINRASLYDQLRKQGVNHADASLQARDLMDFSMQGSFTSIRFLTQVVPFLNARLQGLYKLGRAAKEDPARFSMVLGSVAAISLGLLAAYSDDDDWKKREDWDRNNFWWFKVGGTAFRIPKPFEIGAIATLAERGFELAFDKEMTNKRFMGQVMTLLGDNLSMNPVPQLVKPMLDVYANKDSFSGRPIETMGMEKLKSEYRFTDRTSMAARAASTSLNAVTGLVGKEALSPVQIDSMLRGYFGWLGSFIVGAGDKIARPATDQKDQASPDYWKVATGSIVSDLGDAPSRYVSAMYDQAKTLEEAYGTYRMLVKEGKTEEAKEFMVDHRDELTRYKRVEAVKRTEAKFNERIRMIERSALSSDAKRDAIRKVKEQKDRVARQLTPA